MCCCGDDTVGEFQPQFCRLRQIEPDSFFGNVLDRDTCGAFAEQNARERFGNCIARPIVTEPDAGHGAAFGRVRIIHEQRQLAIAGGLDHPVEALDDRVVALDIDGVDPTANKCLGRLEHLSG